MNRGVPSLLTALVTLLIAFAGSTRAQDFDASPHSTPPLAEPPGLAELPPPAAPKAPPGFAPPASLVGGTWNRLGPAPTVNAQLTVPPSNKVAGAVQAIAAHPTDPDILYIGAVNGGIWRTMDATSADPTWTPLTDALPSQAIGSLEFDPTDATRQTLIAGSARVSSFAARGGILIGVLYSTNGGDSWTLFGTNQFANENLTSVAARGNVLMACSDNASTGLGSGLFRSVNTGGTFTQVSGGNGLTTGAVSDLVGDPGNLNRFYAAVRTVGIFRSDDNGATWTNVTSGITGISSSTSKIEMAAHSSGGTNAVYVGVLNSSVLASMWRSTNLGASWTQLDAPSTGAQGNIHFSIVADPTNSALVYIGGQSGYFRINAALPLGSQSTSIQGANANNTTPHADSREMVFDANGNIIEGSDGGVYRRVSPQSSAGSWVSVVGDLGVIEAHDVAWDSVTHTAMTGTQDNGTHISPLNGDLVWNWISGGDGGDVAIDDRSLPGQSIRYGSSQNLGGFYRRTYDASNVQRSNVSPALTLLAGSPAISGQFVTPVEINKIDPARLAIGGANSVYESLDRGDSVTALATNFGVNRVALAYGGRLNGVANPDVIYYGSSATVRLRTTFGGPVTATAGTFPGGTVRDVVMNTNDWRQVFAIDISGVYTTPDAGTNWVNITGNLTGVGELRQLEFFHFGVADCVAVGTDVGVFISYINDLGNWTQLGSGLPATSAFDLVYSPQDSLLVVGTLGRGVYTLSIPQLFPIITTNAAALLSESCVASNGLIDPGEFVTVAFSLRNIGSGSTSNLVATLLASGGVVNPSAPQTYGVLTGGGAPVTNNFTFRADGPCGGTLTARLMLADGTADLGVASFTFPLGLPPFSGTFKQTNAAAITIPASGAATPYPSSNIISGLPGLITKVTVTLSNFTHNLPADVDVLLVSPAGQKVMLMSDAGGTNTPGTNIVLTATDSGHYDDTGFHDPAIQNYIAGDNGGGFENRNFFTFNIPTLPPGTVTSAELRVDTFTITTANASETYELRQVTNTVAALTAGGSGLTGIYSDLANGTIYGSRAFTTNEQNQVIAIPLNASAVTDIVAHAGSPFAVGGTVTTLDGNTNSVERLFAFSSTGAANVQLVLHLAAAVTLTFDDAAPTGLPTNTLNTGTFKPTDYQSGDVLPGPAPAGPYGTNLSAFNGFSPNGTWQLFVSDDTAANSGAFSNGWALSLSVAQDCCLDSAAADVGLKLTAAPDPVLVGSNLTFTIVVSNNGPATATGVVVTNDLPAGVNFVSASTTQGTINTNLSGDVIASIGSLTPGANATIAVIVKPTVEAILTTTATIKANQFDYNSFNNSDTVAPVAFLPTLSINNVTLTEGNSGTSNFVFTVTLTPAYGQAVTAQFTTEDDTAVEGSDYLATNGIVTFPPGITNQTITVKVIGDTLSESNETFMLVLNNASNATFAIDPGAEEDEPAAPDTAAVGTILDDDPLPTFQYTTNFTVVEGNSGTTNVVLALNLSAASGRNITVNFATANSTATAGSDYVSKSGAAVFPPGATTSNLTFTVNGDTSVESNEVFFVNFSAAVNATLTNTQARITILNDDGVPGNLDHFTWSAISSPQGANVPFLVTLSGLDISNNLATNFAGPAVLRGRDAGTGEFFRTNFDGGLTGFTVSNTFGLGAGLWHLSTGRATNAGHSASNSLYYGTNETINGGGNYNTGANQGVVISPSINLAGAATPLTLSFNHLLQTEANTNYDRALVEISTDNGNTFALLAGNNVAGGPIANTGGLWVPVNLDISSYAGRQIRLRFQFNTIDSAANNFEGWYVDDIVIATTPPAIPIAPTLTGTFTNGVWTGFVQVTQIATNMQLVAGDANGHTNNSGSFSVTNFNDLTINSASVVEGNSGSVTATFTVTLAPTNAAPVSVSFTTVDGSAFAGEDYVATNGTLIFMPGDTTKSITVTILGDTIVEPNENFFVALTAATNAYILDGQGAGTILNDDGGPQVSESPRNDFWIPNGTVNAVLETNGTIYLGGSFTEMGLTNVGHATAFERNAGAVAPGFPLIDRNVNAIIDDGGGGSFLGGDFFNVGGVPRVRLAHIRADRTLDTNFNANFSGIINALALDATNLYVGGLFTVVTNGVSTFLRTNFAILNPSNGAVRVFTNNPGFSSTVIALALRPPLLYLGGNFTNVGAAGSNYARARLAAINTSNNLPAAWAADTDNNVNALAVSSYVVYAGGLFTTVAGQPRFRFAALDATTGTPTTPVTHFNSTVQSLLAAGSNIYVGGFFTSATNGAITSGRSNLVAIDATSGAVSAWNPLANGAVRAMALDGTNLVVGGDFTGISGQPDRRRLAIMNTISGATTAFDPDLGNSVNAVSVRSNFIYAGGTFTFIKGAIRNRLAAIDAATGALTPWSPQASSTVQVLAGAGTKIYAGGFFTVVTNGTTAFTRNRLVSLDAVSGAVDPNFAPTFGNTVRALTVGGSNLYVGGDFTNVTIGTTTNIRQGLAAINLTNGALRAGFFADITPGANSGTNVTALAFADGVLYVGGSFSNLGGQVRYRLASVDGTTGAVTAWNPDCNGSVLTLLLDGNVLFAGGTFTSITNASVATTRNRLAALDPDTGVVSAWNPNASSTVNALALRGTNLYVGGVFSTIGGVSRNFLAALDSTLASSAAASWNPNMQTTVNAVFANTNRVIAGGLFAAVGNQPIADLAVFQPDTGPLLTNTAGALSYTENNPPTIIDAGLTITDPDGPSIASATVRITNNLAPLEDLLGFTPVSGINTVFSPETGTLVLTGQSALSNYLAVLRSVTYSNASENPSTLTRTVQFIVNDGISNSPPSSRAINITAVNDPPVISTIADVTTVENFLSAPAPFTISDAESAASNLFLSAVPVNPVLAPGTNITFAGSGTNRTVTILPGTNQSGSTTITVFVSDGTNVSSTPFLFLVLTDTDHDGIPDVYENAHGMNPNDPTDAAKDFDGDGLSNLQEYLAGTDPNDSRNFLGIIAVTVIAPDVQVSFSSISGKLYRVERTDNIALGMWTTVADNVPGTGGIVAVTDTGAASLAQRTYRVRLLP